MVFTLSATEQHIATIFSQSETWPQSQRLLEEIGTSPNIKSILQSLLVDKERLHHSAAMSYHHPNGFDRIVLLNHERPEYKLRLHIWWPGQPTLTETIHNHAWNFSSVVITGAFRFQYYTRGVQRKYCSKMTIFTTLSRDFIL